MEKNKPLIFINSAQSLIIKDGNQYTYDSRFDKSVNIPYVKRNPVTEKPEMKKETVKEPVIQKEIIPEVKDENINKKDATVIPEPEINEVEVEVRKKKLQNKMELLNKRARLGRYVLVNVEVEDNKIEGYFMKLLDRSIIINTKEEELEILITNIKDIAILKV